MCEAMHGAILCDAYGIPWLPVFTYPGISHSKWNDVLGQGTPKRQFSIPPRSKRQQMKKLILSQFLGNSIAEVVSAQYEKLMTNVFLKKLQSISAKSNFLLSDREMVSRTISLQQDIIGLFLLILKDLKLSCRSYFKSYQSVKSILSEIENFDGPLRGTKNSLDVISCLKWSENLPRLQNRSADLTEIRRVHDDRVAIEDEFPLRSVGHFDRYGTPP